MKKQPKNKTPKRPKQTTPESRSSTSYIKDLVPYYKPYRGLFALDLLCSLLAAGVDLIFPLFVERITKEAIDVGLIVLSTVLKVAVFLVLLRVIEVACRYTVNRFGHYMGVRIESDLRRNLFRHLENLPHSYFDNQKVGALMSRITTDLFDITEFSHHCPETLLISAVRIIGTFIVLISREWKMTLCLFALLPFMALLVIVFNNKWDKNHQKNRGNMSNINAQIEDTLSGIRVVKSFANEELELKKFDEGNRAFVETRAETYKYMGQFFAGLRGMDAVMYLSILILGALFKISAPLFILYLLYANTLLNSLVAAADYTEQFQRGITAFRRYQEIMDTKNELTDREGAVEIGEIEGSIEFNNVSFSYAENTRNVLENLSFSAKRGETVAIVGPSGGGKTTIANLIPRFYDISDGSITIDGVDVRDVTMRSLRREIGVVAQDVYLFWGTIAQNIAYGKPDATREEIIAAARLAGVHEFVEPLPEGYDSFVGERGIKLSGGQKQRVSIARVFLKNPPILILDEATSALDNESEVRVQKSLDKLAEGRTSIIIAHRLSTIRNANKIIVLTDKGIAETGTHAELMKNGGLYKKLYDLSVRTESLREINP